MMEQYRDTSKKYMSICSSSICIAGIGMNLRWSMPTQLSPATACSGLIEIRSKPYWLSLRPAGFVRGPACQTPVGVFSKIGNVFLSHPLSNLLNVNESSDLWELVALFKHWLYSAILCKINYPEENFIRFR